MSNLYYLLILMEPGCLVSSPLTHRDYNVLALSQTICADRWVPEDAACFSIMGRGGPRLVPNPVAVLHAALLHLPPASAALLQLPTHRRLILTAPRLRALVLPALALAHNCPDAIECGPGPLDSYTLCSATLP
jgi:hypothetical protein